MLEELGRFLKEEREAQGLSLKDVQVRLKIQMRYLEAIEQGRLDEIPGRVYARGFVRSYARLLGVDVSSMLDALPPDENELPPGEGAPQVPTEYAVKPRRSYGWVWLLVGLVLVGGYVWYSGSHHRAVTTSPKQQGNQKTAGKGTSAGPTGGAKPSSSAPAASSAPAPSPTLVSHRRNTLTYQVPSGTQPSVTLAFSQRCWYRVTVDGTVKANGERHSGTQSFSGNRQVIVRVGYPPGVTVSVLGTSVPMSGTSTYVIIVNAQGASKSG